MGIKDILGRLFSKPYTTVRPEDVADLVKQRRALIVDVRGTDEWRAGRAPKARHIPLDQLADRARDLPSGRPLVTVCRSGARSARAATMLAREGWEVFNVAGGMRAWERAGLPVTASGGKTGQIA